MFRTMRRFKQQISEEECIRILQEGKRGILSMHGENGYPYGIPMNHRYQINARSVKEKTNYHRGLYCRIMHYRQIGVEVG